MHSLAEIRRPRTRRKLGPQRLDDLLGSQAMLGRKRDISRGASAAMGQVRAVPVLPGHQRATTRSRQRAAGTRRVHQPGHARARLDTADTPQSADLQEKRDRECPAVYADTASEPPW
jgi:hypothetical protein